MASLYIFDGSFPGSNLLVSLFKGCEGLIFTFLGTAMLFLFFLKTNIFSAGLMLLFTFMIHNMFSLVENQKHTKGIIDHPQSY